MQCEGECRYVAECGAHVKKPSVFSLKMIAQGICNKVRGGVEDGSRRGQGGVKEGSGSLKSASFGMGPP